MFRMLNKTNISHRAICYKTNIFGFKVNSTLVRNYKAHPITIDPKAEQRFKLIDKIGNDCKLVYREHELLSKLLVGVYQASWVLLFVGIYVVSKIIYTDPSPQETETDDPMFEKAKQLSAGTLGLIFSIVCILTCKMVPIRIYHNEMQELYKVVFVSKLWYKEIVTFSEGTLVPTFKNKFMKDYMFNINRRPVIFDKECFKSQSTLDRMTGKTE